MVFQVNARDWRPTTFPPTQQRCGGAKDPPTLSGYRSLNGYAEDVTFRAS
jgi:hypothetical protein